MLTFGAFTAFSALVLYATHVTRPSTGCQAATVTLTFPDSESTSNPNIATVTFYDVIPTLAPTALHLSEAISHSEGVIGFDSDGKTIYHEVGVLTKEVFYNDFTTITSAVDPLPSTYTVTFAEGDEGFARTYPLTEELSTTTVTDIVAESCAFQGTTWGVCGRIIVNDRTTVVTSFTGPMAPAYTAAFILPASNSATTRWGSSGTMAGILTVSSVLLTCLVEIPVF
ncbi:hypothetical protein NP233_g3474 [Leucocoprinus birnbaumii]|uniref:Uncharacterized protein n=1 Tax=Leucocoprinus birnbaumii TaxID=56174 RepID=A0AAD5YWE3_9AGAR|nr:hypothetical protein NP233_g3474 [Leucocoprinus birnbaumii]